MSANFQYGKEAKSSLFHLDPSLTFTNHGSFGSVPQTILAKKMQLQLELESAPDRWFRQTSNDLWHKSLGSLGQYLNVSPSNLLLCENASDAINSVLRSIEFETGDAILVTDKSFQTVIFTVDFVSKYRRNEDKHVPVFEVPLQFPIESAKTILDALEKTCQMIVEKGLNLKLAVLDHISSSTAILFPVEQMNAIIRRLSKNCVILIDGAHSIGQIDLSLNTLDCDFYVSNLHKWFLSPRGSAFLYFRSEALTKRLEPNYISWGYQNAHSVSYNFYQRATRDATSWFLVQECIDFYETRLGGRAVISVYCGEMLSRVVPMLVEAWGTSSLQIGKDLEAPFMKVVKLPRLKSYVLERPQDGLALSIRLNKDILEKYKVVPFIIHVGTDLYTRVSCFVYNDMDDYNALRDAILHLKDV